MIGRPVLCDRACTWFDDSTRRSCALQPATAYTARPRKMTRSGPCAPASSSVQSTCRMCMYCAPASSALAAPQGTTGKISGWRVMRVRPYGRSFRLSSRLTPPSAVESASKPGTSDSGDGLSSDAIEMACAPVAAAKQSHHSLGVSAVEAAAASAAARASGCRPAVASSGHTSSPDESASQIDGSETPRPTAPTRAAAAPSLSMSGSRMADSPMCVTLKDAMRPPSWFVVNKTMPLRVGEGGGRLSDSGGQAVVVVHHSPGARAGGIR
eukprot:scaffold117691_cov77-Phaeocystis_antarctica.AAC.2